MSAERLAGAFRRVAVAAMPAADLRRAQRVDLAITGDGEIRLERAAGRLGRHNLGVQDAASIATSPTAVSPAQNLDAQVDAIGSAVELNALAVGDTTSISLDIILVGVVNTIFAVANFAGSGAAETVARSDHTHTGVYAPASLTATAALDFPSIPAQSCVELTIAVAGAVANDAISVGPPAAWTADLSATGYVSAADVVTVRMCNPTAAAIDPPSQTYRVRVVR